MKVSIFLGVLVLCRMIIYVDSTEEATGTYDKDFLEKHVNTLTQQILLQQFFKEQRVRSEGHSGLHLVRQRRSGDKNYFVETHNGYAAGSIHDHANNIRTVGLGQFSAVLNGVEFQTRHNDYRLNMPHRTSGEYNAVEPISFPDVPPEVLNKPNVQDQIEEMREWFKAWQNEDSSSRDYTKYFKPVLCYLEGGWTKSDPSKHSTAQFEEFIDSKVWMDVRQTSKANQFNLPRKIIDFHDGVAVYAEWEYRILCHPLKEYLSLKKLKLKEDLSSRMMTGSNKFKHIYSRAARFSIQRTETDRPIASRDLLDELMEQIPGKDNYQGLLYDESLDSYAFDDNLQRKDASRYHRWYRTKVADASGISSVHRGFSDDNFFAALTTQSQVMGLNITKCKNNRRLRDCKHLYQKWTYAIPLEIIYLTPLSKWNPYGLMYHGLHVKGTPATLGGRYGDCVPWKKKELNGTNSKRFYQTPDEFFSGPKLQIDEKADTARPFSCVLDPSGTSRRVRASGIYTLLPRIDGVGHARQRYPIFPVHGEGSSVWKELNALRDIILNIESHKSMLWSREHFKTLNIKQNIELTMGESKNADVTPHTHYIELSKAEIIQIKGGKEIHKETSMRSGHNHVLRVRWDGEKKQFFYFRCDKLYRCWDGHSKTLINEEEEEEM